MLDTTYIREAMVRQRVKMQDLARAVNISKSSLWRKMNGKTDFKAAELKAIENYLNIN